jgi:hypothetical protein
LSEGAGERWSATETVRPEGDTATIGEVRQRHDDRERASGGWTCASGGWKSVDCGAVRRIEERRMEECGLRLEERRLDVRRTCASGGW